jgi:hypothetical protein
MKCYVTGEDLVFCPITFPSLKENDLVEIFNPEDESPHLLMKVAKGSLREDFPQRG